MEARHTPQPWDAEIDPSGKYFPSVFLGPKLKYRDNSGSMRAKVIVNEGPTPEDVASGYGFGSTMETCNANALLIAAAPDLLGLANGYRALLIKSGAENDGLLRLVLERVDAAIAKATRL